jgi:hypothetical protein
MERRRRGSPEEVQKALDALDASSFRVRADQWPTALSQLDLPGLYSWWVDQSGADDISEGLGVLLRKGRIYAGQTGATKWPSGKTGRATLRSRIGRDHFRGSIRSSTFRLTLAAALRDSLRLQPVGPRRLEPESERLLTDWIASHLEVAVFPFQEADVLLDLERRVVARLDPPLNLEGMALTPLRVSLSKSRGLLGSAPGP